MRESVIIVRKYPAERPAYQEREMNMELHITCIPGDGIGPEIVVRALSHKETYEKCRPIVTGDAAVMEEAVKLLGFDFKINAVDKVSDAKFEYGTIDVFDLHCVDMSTFKFGEVTATMWQCGIRQHQKSHRACNGQRS